MISSPPSVSANPATTGVPIDLSAQATDADGDALDYEWDFGDGTAGVGASISKTYAAAGVYIVQLTVFASGLGGFCGTKVACELWTSAGRLSRS